jgi:hypothetical protein
MPLARATLSAGEHPVRGMSSIFQPFLNFASSSLWRFAGSKADVTRGGESLKISNHFSPHRFVSEQRIYPESHPVVAGSEILKARICADHN